LTAVCGTAPTGVATVGSGGKCLICKGFGCPGVARDLWLRGQLACSLPVYIQDD
jgi:hypothetical protein